MRYIFIVLGFLFTLLGGIGVVLPILPTTPFLLLASFCFAKGSTRFHKWFTNTKLYKNHLDEFVKSRSMTLKTKITLLSLASAMLVIPIVVVDIPHLRIFLILLMVFKYYYFIFRIKTIRGEDAYDDKQKIN